MDEAQRKAIEKNSNSVLNPSCGTPGPRYNACGDR